jgi:hypothetical protein
MQQTCNMQSMAAMSILGDVTVDVRVAPIASRLALFAHTHGADVSGVLPDSYEGQFALEVWFEDREVLVACLVRVGSCCVGNTPLTYGEWVGFA